MIRFVLVAATIVVSVIAVMEGFDCLHNSTWRDWAAMLINSAWWQGLGIFAWQYWTAIYERDRAQSD